MALYHFKYADLNGNPGDLMRGPWTPGTRGPRGPMERWPPAYSTRDHRSEPRQPLPITSPKRASLDVPSLIPSFGTGIRWTAAEVRRHRRPADNVAIGYSRLVRRIPSGAMSRPDRSWRQDEGDKEVAAGGGGRLSMAPVLFHCGLQQLVSVSDHSALPRLAAICSRIHASTSDSIQPMARAPSRIGLGKLPLATRT